MSAATARFNTSWMATRCWSPRRRPNEMAKKAIKVTRPRPPSWIRIRRKTCPVVVNVEPTGTVTSPVTETAEVDVNSASSRDIPDTVALGKIRRAVPAIMSTTKLVAIVMAGRRTNAFMESVDVATFSRRTRTTYSCTAAANGPAVEENWKVSSTLGFPRQTTDTNRIASSRATPARPPLRIQFDWKYSSREELE